MSLVEPEWIGSRSFFSAVIRVSKQRQVLLVGRVAASAGGAFDRTAGLSVQVLDTLGNVVRIIGNTFGPAADPGGGLLAVVQQTTAELARVSASPELQSALSTLVDTAGRLGPTAAPLIGQPLGEPVQELIAELGRTLPPLLEELGPALDEASPAAADLTAATAPLLPALGRLLGLVLVALAPVLEAWAGLVRAFAPDAQRLASALVEVEERALPVARELLVLPADAAAGLVRSLLPPIADLVEALAPAATALAEAGEDLTPALRAVADATEQRLRAGLVDARPLASRAVDGFAAITLRASEGLADLVRTQATPALYRLADAVRGDAVRGDAVRGGTTATPVPATAL